MAPILILFAFLTGVVSNKVMLRKMNNDMRAIRYSYEQLNKLFKFALPHFHCVQVETDGTHFSQSFMEDLHESNEIPPLVNGGKWDSVMGCKGFILLGSNYAAIKALIKKTPRHSEHRIIVIIKGSPNMALNDALMGGVDIYGDADVVLVASGDLTSGYLMAQPKRYFSHFTKHEEWEYDENGPSDFLGREINAMTYNCTIFSKLGPINETRIPRWRIGVEIEMFEEITHRLNLKQRYTAIDIPKNTVWFKKPLLEDNKTDIAFCGILLTSNKLDKKISFSDPFALLCLKNLVPRPVPVNLEWDGVFQPFEPGLWIAIALVLLSAAFVLQRFSMSTMKYSNAKGIKKYQGLGGSFIQLLSIMVMTDVPRSSPKQGSVRHLLTWWAFYSMILSTCFSSSLISHLTNVEYTKKPNTVEELVKKKYRWAMEIKPDFSELLNSQDKWQAQWKHRFMKVRSKEEHMRLIKKGKQVLWGYYVYGGFSLPDVDLPQEILKNYEVTNNCFMDYFLGYALKKGSPFKRPMNRYIKSYVEGGLVEALFRQVHARRYTWYKYVYTVLRTTKETFSETNPLSVEHLLGIFIVWALGIALSIVVFILELAQKCWI